MQAIMGGGGGPVLLRQDIVLREGATWEQQFELTTASVEFQIAAAATGKPPERASVELVLAAEAGSKPPSEWNGLPSHTRLPFRNGVVRAEDIVPGSYVYVVRSAGFEEVKGQVYVSGAAAPELIQLQPKAAPADPPKAPAPGNKPGG
jgi:hypothetical protein